MCSSSVACFMLPHARLCDHAPDAGRCCCCCAGSPLCRHVFSLTRAFCTVAVGRLGHASLLTIAAGSYSGSFIEERFFKAWLDAGRALPQVYLPIGWSTYFWSHRRVAPRNHTIADEARDRVRWKRRPATSQHIVRLCVASKRGRLLHDALNPPCEPTLRLAGHAGFCWIASTAASSLRDSG